MVTSTRPEELDDERNDGRDAAVDGEPENAPDELDDELLTGLDELLNELDELLDELPPRPGVLELELEGPGGADELDGAGNELDDDPPRPMSPGPTGFEPLHPTSPPAVSSRAPPLRIRRN